MKREEYHALKEQLKGYAINLRQHKVSVKEWQREGQNIVDFKGKDYWDYRAGHIFMSLVRGKTREQIESNFANQQGPGSNFFGGSYYRQRLEDKIAALCDRFGFEPDRDEFMRVVGITPAGLEVEASKAAGA